MNIVKAINKIAVIFFTLLIYWVFIFICNTAFGFRIFRENMTEIFYLSVIGIFAVLGASITLNIMFNLTAIAENKDRVIKEGNRKIPRKYYLGFIISFFVIFALLFAGDYATSKKKENRLLGAAQSLVDEQGFTIEKIAEYNFSDEYLKRVTNSVKLLSRIDENFPRITAILRDDIDDRTVLLGFNSYYYDRQNSQKEDYILSTSAEERMYLNSIFNDQKGTPRYSSNDGRYELYFPVSTSKGLVVLHLSEYSRYGKLGS